MLDHMLRHYRESGIDSLLVNIQLEDRGDPLYEQVHAISKKYGAQINSVFVGKWLQSVNPYLYRHTLEQAPNDWFILADADELQVYLGDIRVAVESVSSAGYDYIEGFLIDRVARDGGFPEVSAKTRLWDEFPMAGLITFPLLRANILKVAAAKGAVRIAPGQHYAYQGTGCPHERYYIPVHHFKWTAGLLGRLRKRVEFYKSIGDGLWLESQRVLSYCEKYGGRINVNERAFRLRESGIVCPHEKDLRALVSANAHKMPRPR